MALAPFFERVYGSLGGHLSISREALNASLASTIAGICCGPVLTTNETSIAELATNLIARLYPRVAILGSDSCVSPLKKLASEINDRSAATFLPVVLACTPNFIPSLGITGFDHDPFSQTGLLPYRRSPYLL